jgi:hypothetical protein
MIDKEMSGGVDHGPLVDDSLGWGRVVLAAGGFELR